MQSTKQSKSKPDYPCLMTSALLDLVVLFTEPKTGTVVWVGEDEEKVYPVGHVGTFSMDDFTEYTGDIILSN